MPVPSTRADGSGERFTVCQAREGTSLFQKRLPAISCLLLREP